MYILISACVTLEVFMIDLEQFMNDTCEKQWYKFFFLLQKTSLTRARGARFIILFTVVRSINGPKMKGFVEGL